MPFCPDHTCNDESVVVGHKWSVVLAYFIALYSPTVVNTYSNSSARSYWGSLTLERVLLVYVQCANSSTRGGNTNTWNDGLYFFLDASNAMCIYPTYIEPLPSRSSLGISVRRTPRLLTLWAPSHASRVPIGVYHPLFFSFSPPIIVFGVWDRHVLTTNERPTRVTTVVIPEKTI